MVSALLLGMACVALEPGTSAPSEKDRAEYRELQASAGRGADAQVKLALWCEAHGLRAERVKHLALAVLADPANATARGLMGLVAYRGRWQRPQDVTDKVKADADQSAARAEYEGRRAKVRDTADAHWQLALWCEEHGLPAEAKAHLTMVVRLDPSREAAWKRLGCKKHNGRWMTEAQIAAEKDEIEAQKKADRSWRAQLSRWAGWLKDKDKRAKAEQELAAVTDPRAVPSVWAVFVNGGAASQPAAVRLLGQIDSPGASRALALLAVGGESPEVRRVATEILKRRDPRESVGLLISMFRDPVKYEVRPVGGPGSPGALFVQGKQFNVQRLYAPPALPNIPLYAGEPVGYDQYGLPVVSRYLGPSATSETRSTSQGVGLDPFVWAYGQTRYRYTKSTTTTQTTVTPNESEMLVPIGQIFVQYQASALVAQGQLRNDVEQVESYNASARASNAAVSLVLHDITGQDLGDDRKAWTTWWVDQLGYSSSPEPDLPRPTVVENVPLAYVPQGVIPTVMTQVGTPVTTTSVSTSVTLNHNCFKAGTPVRTLEGLRPIESLRVGDQLLTQDEHSGVLSYQPVLAVYHNKPSPTLKVNLGDETVVATPIHRFWKAGLGWTMARDLKPGDAVRTLDGTRTVDSVESDVVQPVFNAEVASGRSFFVGKQGVLVHDNSLVQPVLAPFDAKPDLAAVAHASQRD